jgi:hypothetical protein
MLFSLRNHAAIVLNVYDHDHTRAVAEERPPFVFADDYSPPRFNQ